MVVSSIASSAAVALVHARVIHGYLLDRVAAGADQPLVILELGARSGRFAHQLIHGLVSRCQRLSRPMEIPFVYVLAGRDDEAIERWQAHRQLEPLIARGWLDFARVDLGDNDHAIALRHTGIELSAETRTESLVVIANQIFSRDAQDLFYIERGQLYRCTQSANANAEAYQLDAVADAAVYERESWNRILGDYTERLGLARFSFPTQALAWMERLRQLSGHGMLLCADRGYVYEDNLTGRALPSESESGPHVGEVNFNALAEFVLRTGGAVLASAQPGLHFMVAAFLHNANHTAAPETTRAFHDAVEGLLSPDELYKIVPLIESSLVHASAEQLCAYVRLSGWDDQTLTRCMPHLLALVQAGDVSADARLLIWRMVEEVWASYFAECEPDESGGLVESLTDSADRPTEKLDIAFAIGLLLFGLAYYEQATAFFEHSLVQCGQSAAVYFNLAMCAVQLGQFERALEHVDTALAQNSNFTRARDMRLRVMGNM